MPPGKDKSKMTWARLANDPSISKSELPRIAAAFGLSKPKAKPTAKAAKASKAGMKKAFDKPRTKGVSKAGRKPVRASAEMGAMATTKTKSKTTTTKKPKKTTTTRELYKHKVIPAKPSRSLGKAGRSKAQPERRELVYGGGSLADTGTRQRRRQGVAGARPGGRRGR
jgi:hypothetical protein